jgi:neutral ceramidase
MGNKYMITVSFFLIFNYAFGFSDNQKDKLKDVGVARIDITPEKPERLSGYSGRDNPFESVHHKLWAKAMAFGNKDDRYSILITLDLLGIYAEITEKVRSELGNLIALNPEDFTICASHTHSGPKLETLFPILTSP